MKTILKVYYKIKMRKTYDEIVNIFTTKNCELYTTKDEYIAMKEPNKCKFLFKTNIIIKI